MDFALLMSPGACVLLAISLTLFLMLTFACSRLGVFERHDDAADLCMLEVVVLYVALWVLPTTLGWSIWAACR